MLRQYVIKDSKKLRCGYTTGSCAAAATKAAVEMLLSEKDIEHVKLMTPQGTKLLLEVEEILRTDKEVSCAIRKDAGDDPDVTHGILVYAYVSKSSKGISIQGGVGVGVVTRPGLDQPIGEAAINTVPRRMIQQEVEKVCEAYHYIGGITIVLTIPEGVEIAKKTFNPRLGIEGGLSILGTTGIVEPMSESALIETIRIEMRQQIEEGYGTLLITPGNYGMTYLKEQLGVDIEVCVKCSNYIGETIDHAKVLGAKRLVLVGHIGKLVKLGIGIMNTHSKWADGRMETLTACCIQAGGSLKLAKEVLEANTTDEALQVLDNHQLLEATMKVLMSRIAYHLGYRSGGLINIEVIVFSHVFGILGMTEGAMKQIEEIKKGACI